MDKSIYLILHQELYLKTRLYQGYISRLYREFYHGYTIFWSQFIFVTVAIFAFPTGQIGLTSIWLLKYILEYFIVIFSIKHSSSQVKHASKKNINGLIVSLQWPPFSQEWG